ncbi:MAG TPA: hypothetical protein DEH78_26055 [Solibacterales bacterium]|nr:hypothetical protein [Bryobacterales bacterium]
MAQRTIIVGIGSPIAGDDRAGLAVAELLAASPLRGADVREARAGALDLLDLLPGYERAILVDCLVTADPRPGRIHRLGLASMPAGGWTTPHDIGIAEAFELGRQMGIPMPEEVEIIAIEAAPPAVLTDALTPAVQAAVETVAGQLRELFPG